MKQQVHVTVKLSLWLDATLDEDDIATYIRSSLPLAFGEDLTAMENPVDILDIREEAAIYSPSPNLEGTNHKGAFWAGSMIFDEVRNAMQNAEELGGPEGLNYIALMNAIIAEASGRIDTFVCSTLEDERRGR